MVTKKESKLPKLAIKDQFCFRIKEFTILSRHPNPLSFIPVSLGSYIHPPWENLYLVTERKDVILASVNYS